MLDEVSTVTASPAVSVLMTAHNRERYIGEALSSVLSSTFEDFEVVVVDDRSTDSTLEIARGFTARDPRVRVHRNDRNLGDYANRSRAAELARGRYLKYVDSDDILYPHGLAVMVEVMEQFPEAGLGMSCPAERSRPYPVLSSPREIYREHFLERWILGRGPLATIIRGDAFRAVGGFRDLRFVGDVDLWVRLAARYPVAKMPQDLTWWRQHDEQEYSVGVATGAYALGKYRLTRDALTAPGCPLTAEEAADVLTRMRREVLPSLLKLIRRGRVREAWTLARQLDLPVPRFAGGGKAPS